MGSRNHFRKMKGGVLDIPEMIAAEKADVPTVI